ncbi:MAG: hypothetical protein LBN21_06210 [Treponema sp.]|nr:hypothetical protein [Treponema sp.]
MNLFLSSCSAIKAGLYLSSIDSNDGGKILEKESDVKSFLERILEYPEEYTMHVFSRKGIIYSIKRTKLLTHMYYVINSNDGKFHTLSFYGTDMTFRSQGAWALDAESDFGSYTHFIGKENIWDVEEVEKTIDVEHTVLNISKKIESDTTYYYRDHIRNRPKMDNCITAVLETLIEKLSD